MDVAVGATIDAATHVSFLQKEHGNSLRTAGLDAIHLDNEQEGGLTDPLGNADTDEKFRKRALTAQILLGGRRASIGAAATVSPGGYFSSFKNNILSFLGRCQEVPGRYQRCWKH